MNDSLRIVASAPGRAGIIGNPSDMYGGSVVSCTIPLRSYVSIEPAESLILESDQGVLHVRSREDLQLRNDLFDILRAVITHQRCVDLRARIRCWSEIPMGSGLSSSSSLVVAALYGLLRYQRITVNKYYFAEMARSIELNHLGVVCGYQDFYMTTFGGLNYLDFRDKEFYREVHSEPYSTVEPLTPYVRELPFIVAHTGMQHFSGQVHKPIRERWLEGDPIVVKAYVTIGQLAREGKKALLGADWPRLGRLMNENHAIQRDLGGSGEANERLIAAALAAGAYGAKLAGAGHGGTIIALHPEPATLREPLQAAGAKKILFLQPLPGVRLDNQSDDQEYLVASSWRQEAQE